MVKIPIKCKLKQGEIEAIFAQLSSDRPNPKTELNYTNPFTLLAAVALSAQSTDVGVNKATKRLFEIADTPQKMFDLGETGVGEFVKTIGLWRNKAKNLILMSRQILDNFGGKVPQTREELVTLAGVGRKTANVVLNEAFGQPTMAVDTHIFRVANRTGLATGKTPEEIELGLMNVIPEKYIMGAHHWLILHGRYVCVARKPKCNLCSIVQFCKYDAKIGGTLE